MMASPSYSIDGVIVDVGNINHLLAQAIEVAYDLDFGIGPNRNHRLDRLMALVNIALDIAAATEAKVEGNYRALNRRV